MKNRFSFAFFLPFLLTLLSFTDAQAQRRGRGEIAVRSEDGEKLSIEVDGRRYDRYGADLLLGNIPSGRRSVIIYRLRPHGRDGGATAQTVYEGQLLVRSGYRILLSVDPKSGAVSIQHVDLTTSAASRKAAPETATIPENSTSNASAPPDDASVPQPAASANGWESQVAAKATDTEKLRILKARVTAQSTPAATVAQMMAALSFEDSRLELAKAALPNLSDRENIALISAALESAEARKAFEESARRQR